MIAPLWLFPIYCHTHLLSIVGSDYVGALWNKEFTQNNQGKYYSTLILGDSTANAAYMPEVLSDSAVNLALAGSSTIEGYYTLEDYLENNKAPKDIFISYMDYHLEEDDFTWDVSNFVHKFTKEQNEEIYRMIKKYGNQSVEELTTDGDYDRTVAMYSIYSPTIYSYSAFKSLGSLRNEENEAAMEDIKTRLGRYSSITNREYEPEGIMGYSKFKVGKLQEKYYIKILDLCEENDIDVHLIKLPLCIDAGFIDDYEDEVADYYDELLEDYDNADFYWFHTTYEHEFFCDSYHMNNHGAFRFSRELKEQYPDIFDEDYEDMSVQRMNAFDADIADENIMAELTKKVGDKPYSIIIVDTTNNLTDLYYPYVGYGDDDVQWLDIGDDSCKYPTWFVDCDGEGLPEDISYIATDSGLTVTYGSDVESIIATEEMGISFVVIDKINHKVVCNRQCLFTDRGFRDIL